MSPGPFTEDKPAEAPPIPPAGETREKPPAQRRDRRTAAERKRATEIKDLERQLADTAKMAALGVLLANPRGYELAARPEVVGALEQRCEKFAAAWAAVAKEDERVAILLARLMQGGVWINAVAQTIALGVIVMVFSGRVPVPLPMAQALIPELRQFQFVPAQGPPGTVPPVDVDDAGPDGAYGFASSHPPA